MTREEQIITEAKKHYYDDINCHNAFLHGVEWAEEHPQDIWHETSEKPQDNSHILICYNYLGTMEFKSYHINYQCDLTWSELVNFQEIRYWSYIDVFFRKEVKNENYQI